jgi:hypothetical protein
LPTRLLGSSPRGFFLTSADGGGLIRTNDSQYFGSASYNTNAGRNPALLPLFD